MNTDLLLERYGKEDVLTAIRTAASQQTGDHEYRKEGLDQLYVALLDDRHDDFAWILSGSIERVVGRIGGNELERFGERLGWLIGRDLWAATLRFLDINSSEIASELIKGGRKATATAVTAGLTTYLSNGYDLEPAVASAAATLIVLSLGCVLGSTRSTVKGVRQALRELAAEDDTAKALLEAPNPRGAMDTELLLSRYRRDDIANVTKLAIRSAEALPRSDGARKSMASRFKSIHEAVLSENHLELAKELRLELASPDSILNTIGRRELIRLGEPDHHPPETSLRFVQLYADEVAAACNAHGSSATDVATELARFLASALREPATVATVAAAIIVLYLGCASRPAPSTAASINEALEALAGRDEFARQALARPVPRHIEETMNAALLLERYDAEDVLDAIGEAKTSTREFIGAESANQHLDDMARALILRDYTQFERNLRSAHEIVSDVCLNELHRLEPALIPPRITPRAVLVRLAQVYADEIASAFYTQPRTATAAAAKLTAFLSGNCEVELAGVTAAATIVILNLACVIPTVPNTAPQHVRQGARDLANGDKRARDLLAEPIPQDTSETMKTSTLLVRYQSADIVATLHHAKHRAGDDSWGRSIKAKITEMHDAFLAGDHRTFEAGLKSAFGIVNITCRHQLRRIEPKHFARIEASERAVTVRFLQIFAGEIAAVFRESDGTAAAAAASLANFLRNAFDEDTPVASVAAMFIVLDLGCASLEAHTTEESICQVLRDLANGDTCARQALREPFPSPGDADD